MALRERSHARVCKTGLLAGISMAALVTAHPTYSMAAAAAESATAPPGMEDIVVTSRRRNEQLQTQPISISAFTGATLERMNIRHLDELQSIPNVSITAQPGFINGAIIGIRGISQGDPILSLDQPIGMYVDGVLIPRAVGNLFDLLEPDRIEVLKGPQGSLFGRNTTAGVISVTLPKPTDEFGASVKASYATNNEITLRGIIDTGLIGNTGLKAKLVVQQHQMDGYVRNLVTPDASHWPGSDNTQSMLFRLDGDIGTIGTFDYKFDYSHTLQTIMAGQLTSMSPDALAYFGASPSFGGDPLLVSPKRLGSVYLPLTPFSKGHQMGNALTLDFPISDALDIKSITAIRSFKTDTAVSSTGAGRLEGLTLNLATFQVGVTPVSPYNINLGVAGGGDGGEPEHQHQVSEELQFSGQLDRHKYVGGLYFFDETGGDKYSAFLTVIDFSPFVPPSVGLNSPGGLDYSVKAQSYAAYLSDSYTPPILNDKLEITGGIRYTIDRKFLNYLNDVPGITLATASKYKRFGALSGDATAKYQWSDDIMTYLRFANAYGSGGFSGRDDPSAAGFDPETANNFEGGVKSEFLDKRVRLNADVFFTKYSDEQITTFAQGLNANGVNSSHVVNAGSSQYLGSEVELTMIPVTGMDVELSWGHTWPKFNTFFYQPQANGPVFNIAGSARFGYFSKTSYSIGGGYTFGETPVGELSIRMDFSYKSGSYYHASDTFNPLNEFIKGGGQSVLNGSITLAHIPINMGRSDLALAVYGKNLLNQAYKVQGIDYEIIPPGDYYSTGIFARPRVLGVTVTAKY